jgi:pimeloyl-ACP methyl ester carboxylesterase
VTGIHVQRAGSGAPVLLLHGIGGSADSFAPQVPVLARRHEVRAWDAPGYARSADPDRAPGMAGYADAAAALVSGLVPDQGPAHVVGVSWGGVIATRLALRHPRLVRSLVLADSTRGSGRTAATRAGMRARPLALQRDGARAFAAQRGPKLVSPDAPRDLVDRVVTTMAASVRLPGYGYAAASMAETVHDRALPALALPVLVVAGRQDTVTGVKEGSVIAAAIPGARFRIIENAGHLANQEQPGRFNASVEDFWKDLP